MNSVAWRRLGAALFAMATGALGIAIVTGGLSLAASATNPASTATAAPGENPRPARLLRPPARPLSAMAQLGRQIFFDASLSSSGRLSCASCHSPQHAYAAPDDSPAMYGGSRLQRQGVRAVPSLMYLERQPAFSIGPDNEEKENVNLAERVALGRQAVRLEKTAARPSQSAMVPQGGLMWDGRADTLQDQALLPLLDPREMDGGTVETVGVKMQRAPYAAQLAQLFGAAVFDAARFAVAEALFAVARYQVEDSSFHPYTSKFDYWLEGRTRLTPREWRGYILFNDPAKANCAGCHVDQPSREGLPPLLTDHQFDRQVAAAGWRPSAMIQSRMARSTSSNPARKRRAAQPRRFANAQSPRRASRRQQAFLRPNPPSSSKPPGRSQSGNAHGAGAVI